MFYFLTAVGSPINVSEKVSLDIARYKQFETQGEVLRKRFQGDFVTIGADAACDFDSSVVSIQVAIESGAAEIRVATNGTYLNNLTIENQSIVIRGGFADCEAANSNQQVFNDLTIIDGSTIAEPVIYITGSDQQHQISLENLLLIGGTSVFPKFGGGLSVDLASVDLYLLRFAVSDNSGSAGAGMRINAGIGVNSVVTNVVGREVLIINNDSSSIGGGLYCIGSAEIVLSGLSLIGNNTANTGGGVALYHGCSLSMYAEIFTDTLSFLAGIYSNESLSNGGGAYLFNGSELYLFGQQMCDESSCLGSGQLPILVRENEAGLNASLDGNGGGVYLAQSVNQNIFYANGLIMMENTARENGGGSYLDVNGQVVIERVLGPCWHKERCNHIIANSAGTAVSLGGAFYVANDGELNISQTYLEENRADFGTAISASGANATVTLEGVVMDDNGDDGNDGFSDFSVVRADLGARVTLSHSTVVDNNVQGSVFEVGVALDSSMNIFNSIVHDPGSGNLFGPVTGELSINCIMAHEGNSFSGSLVLVDDPEFISRLEGDFHLSSLSPAIDMCPKTALVRAIDIDAEQRGWDDVLNNNGPDVFDAGADESYINDVIFKHGFEA